MEINVDHFDQATVIAVQGSIDALTADSFMQAMQSQVEAGRNRLVADLSNVSYASSAGLRAILVVVKECRRVGGDLRLAAVQKGVYRVFEMSGFNSILKMFDDVQEAVASYSGPDSQ